MSIGIFALLLGLTSCEKDAEGTLYKVSDERMIDEILQDNSELSSFLQIVDRSELRGVIHAYGGYTLFSPTNSAVEAYLSEKGLSLSSISKEAAGQVVKYHLIPDTISTADFIDGRLSSTNFLNKYITTRLMATSEGVSIEINRQGRIVARDLRGANGYVQVIDRVLEHSTTTVNQQIERLPESYSLWKQIYEQSGMKEEIEAYPEDSYEGDFTVFIQDNEAFKSANINDPDDLMRELRAKRPDVADDNMLLRDYVAYHLLDELNYAVDLMNRSSVKTIASGEVIVLKRDVEKILLNEFNSGTTFEAGIPIDRASDFTDLSCSNGVIHTINGNIQIVKRSAYRVYFDIAEQPELIAMKTFRKAGTTINLSNTDLAGIDWGFTGSNKTIKYECKGMPTLITKDNNYLYGDYLNFRLCTKTITWMEFTLPVLVPGTYRVWVTYRNAGSAAPIRSIFKQDGQEDQDLGVFTSSGNKSPGGYGLTTGYDDEFDQKALQDGFKVHVVNSFDFINAAQTCQSLGVIQVMNTGQHILRWEAITGTNSTKSYDQLLFIPTDESQFYPRQDLAGKMIYETTPNCEIYPYSSCDEPLPEE